MTPALGLDDRHYPPTTFARFVLCRDKCDGCGLCVQTCPGQMLVLERERPVHLHDVGRSAVGCIGCRNCLSVCPRDAIEICGQYRVESGYYRTTLAAPSLPNPFGAPAAPAFADVAAELTAVERTIYERRSNRLFKRRPVPEALLRRLLEAARFAPSQGNCQPWSFVVVSDRSLLDRIGRACTGRVRPLSRLYLERDGRSRLKSLAVNLLARLVPNSFDQRLAHGVDTVASVEGYDLFLHAPTLIIVLGDTRGIGYPLIDCALCAHNLVLTAHALGLGTCYVGFTRMLETLPALKRELGIGWPYRVMTSVAVGYPRVQTDRAVARERPRVTWFPADRSGPRVEEQ
jgi:nitroreductase/Pyruvate/2-oxoacid:ferredoxin oxidoreductase delta subunit